MLSTLYIVATPIGNLQDISPRALEVIQRTSTLLCEDTRVTSKLLAVYGIKKPLLSFHQHSDGGKMEQVLARLEKGEDLALVTDAGTPGISDPGGKLVEAVVARFGDQVRIVPIPGPSAVIAALSVSGFAADAFLFLGFPPHKKGRRVYFETIGSKQTTVVFYESTHRILKTLEQLGQIIGDRPIVVCRELTKMYETIYRGTCKKVTEQLKTSSIKGEFVIVVRAL